MTVALLRSGPRVASRSDRNTTTICRPDKDTNILCGPFYWTLPERYRLTRAKVHPAAMCKTP